MACCENLAAVLSACAANRGTAKGLKGELFLACIEDVTSVPSATAHAISGDIVMEDGKLFYSIRYDKVGSSMRSEAQGEGQSKYYLNTATIFIPGLASSLSNIFSPTIRGEYMCIIPDKNNNKRLVGAVGDGAYIAVVEQTDDRNGMILTITWESSELPYYYNGAITLE